jgi:large subunit ribosomal protein L23
MGLLDRWAKKKANEPTVQSEKETAAPASSASVAPAKARKGGAKKSVAKKAAPSGEEKTLVAPPVVKGTTYHVLVAPVITEKASHLQQHGTYAFFVNRNASKHQVVQAVKEVYGVKPVKVAMLNVAGKAKRTGKGMGRRSDYKKAMVTLPKGSTLAVHEGV